MSNVARIETNSNNALTPMEMLDRAVSNGASIETLEKLMGLQERWEKNNARKAFDEAIAAAKAELPIILKNRTGHNDKKFADFAAIAKAIDPIISKHGLSYRFRTRQDERIHVTCVISHRDGHSEETTLAGPADSTGNKNAIQAIGSTLTYLQRYSLTQALGLAASEDDDGTDNDYDTSGWLEKLEACGTDMAKLKTFQSEMKAKRGEIPTAAWKALSSAFGAATRRATAGAAND